MQIKETNNFLTKIIEEAEILEEESSSFQSIALYEHEFFGKIMTLDGVPSVASKTSYRYHESAAQAAMCTHPDAKRVLIIGGGNGGLTREVLRHKEVEHIDVVEIDAEVVALAKKHFDDLETLFADSKVTLHHTDGYAFVRDAADGAYDVILIDALDALGNSVNFDRVFFGHAARIMSAKGVLICRAEDIDLEEDIYRTRLEHTAEFFRFALPFTAKDMLSVTGSISLIYASKNYHPTADLLLQRIDMLDGLKYYNADLHKANFALGTDTFNALLKSMKI